MNRDTPCTLLLALALTIPSAGTASAVDLATPDGKIVVGDTTGLVVGPVGPFLKVPFYLVPEIPAEPVTMNASLAAASTTGAPVLWGYEASDQAARILAYTAGPPVTPVADCIPPFSSNGRGVAYDPVDGNLWYTTLSYPSFVGDGLIHKTTPPQSGACNWVDQIPFGDGPGGTIQDDIGAIDVDGQSRHIWAAGYKQVTVGTDRRSYLYLVNRNNGTIIRSCWVPFRFGGVGNDTLIYARLDGLPGSGRYILTDAGEIETNGDVLMVIDADACQGGVRVTPVAEMEKAVGMSGIDMEWSGLLDSNGENLFNLGGPPFSTATDHGPFGNNAFQVEDISVCAAKARLGAEEPCPY